MPATFHYFPLLPFELRDQIWKFALRPAVPGAHLFCTYPQLFNYTEPEGFSFAFQAFHPFDPLWCLGAPRCLPRTSTFTQDSLALAPTSWLRNNPSAYLIDSGLWSACKESRRVIEHAFRRPEYHGHPNWGISKSVIDEDNRGDSQKQSYGLFALPGVTSYATREEDERRFLSVMPYRDLFILQPFKLSEFYGIGISGTIPFYYPGGLARPSFDWWANYQIALEYDPVWDKASAAPYNSMDRQIIEHLIPQIAEDCILNFWLIDYRIKPKSTGRAGAESGGPPCTGRKVFLGSDRRYVQVLPEECPDSRDSYQDGGPLAFILALENALALYDAGEEWSTLSHSIEFGLLACEYM
jgi:hypothetical protein